MTQPLKTINVGTNKILLITEKDTHTLKLINLKGEVYSRRFTLYEDIPYSAQKFFPNLEDFIKLLQNLINQKNPSEYVIIHDTFNTFDITIKLKLLCGKFQVQNQFKINLMSDANHLQNLNRKINEMEKRLAQFMEGKQKQKQKQKDMKKDLLQIEILSKKKLKQDKKTQKEKEKQKSSPKDSKKPDDKENVSQSPFKIQEKKVTITVPAHQIQASLITKEGINLISVAIHVRRNKLTYVGELNDNQIEEFLYGATKIKNAIQLFSEIKKNLSNKNPDSLKMNEKQNKLEILILIPVSQDKFAISSTDKQESVFAQIDVKPIKQEHREQKQPEKPISPKSNKKSLNTSKNLNNSKNLNSSKNLDTSKNLDSSKNFDTSKQFDVKSTRSFTQPMTKQNIIDNVKSSVLNDSKITKKNQIYSSFDQNSKPGRKRKSNPKVDDDKLSEISFKTKNTVQKLKQAKELKEVKSKKKNKSPDDTDGDFSLSFSYPIRSKSKK